MNRVTALLVVVAATALLAAGCGGSSPKPLSKADYVSQVKAIGQDLSTSLNGIGSPKDAKTAATALTSVQSDLRDAVKKLEDITPPDNVKTAHEKPHEGGRRIRRRARSDHRQAERRQAVRARLGHDPQGPHRHPERRDGDRQGRLQHRQLETEPLEHGLVAPPFRRRLHLQLEEDGWPSSSSMPGLAQRPISRTIEPPLPIRICFWLSVSV